MQKFESSDVVVLRSLIQIILNGFSQHDVNWFGVANCFEKCADIARARAIRDGQLDTRFKKMQWEGGYEKNMD